MFVLVGQNSRVVAEAAVRKLEQVNRTLPEGIVAVPVCDRTQGDRRFELVVRLPEALRTELDQQGHAVLGHALCEAIELSIFPSTAPEAP